MSDDSDAGISTRPPKCKMYGLIAPDPHTIAYAVVQVRLSLAIEHHLTVRKTWFQASQMTQWGSTHKDFRLDKLHRRIVRLFEDDPADSWCIETLKIWKQ
jgi:hypothetical protein